jgi:hypothetical protein
MNSLMREMECFPQSVLIIREAVGFWNGRYVFTRNPSLTRFQGKKEDLPLFPKDSKGFDNGGL